jgi:hypothetical protein
MIGTHAEPHSEKAGERRADGGGERMLGSEAIVHRHHDHLALPSEAPVLCRQRRVSKGTNKGGSEGVVAANARTYVAT